MSHGPATRAGPWTLRLLSLGVGILLAAALGCTLVLATIAYCRLTLTDVPLLPRYPVARRLFHGDGYKALIDAVTRSESNSFDTVHDFDAGVALSRDRFIPTDMYGELKYRNRPDIEALDMVVWSGLRRQGLSVAATPDVRAALRRCRVLALTSLRFDEHGFRRTEFAPRDGQPAVLFVGDSFTEAAQVPAEETFVNLFGRELGAEGLDAVPLNAGVDGYSALEESWIVDRYAAAVRARIVVDTLFPNDVHTEYEKVIRGEGVPEENYRAMFASLERMRDRCRAERIELVISLMPAREQVDALVPATVFQDRVTAWCRVHDVRVLDPLARFRRIGRLLYLPRDPHLSPEGHREYAAFLFEELRTLLESEFARRPA